MATEAEELPVEVTFDATKKKKKKVRHAVGRIARRGAVAAKTGDLQLEADEDAVAAGEGVDAAESQLASLSGACLRPLLVRHAPLGCGTSSIVAAPLSTDS
eukprot:scaffold2090_cov225-Prasinococcus_capsulatus_cf.AAC.12